MLFRSQGGLSTECAIFRFDQDDLNTIINHAVFPDSGPSPNPLIPQLTGAVEKRTFFFTVGRKGEIPKKDLGVTFFLFSWPSASEGVRKKPKVQIPLVRKSEKFSFATFLCVKK